jgi:transposase-like protein
MAEDSSVLRGLVELDETYAGAPPRQRAKPEREDDDRDPPPDNPKGRGTMIGNADHPLVLVAAERGGRIDAQVIATHGKEAIREALQDRIAPEAVVITDGLPAYQHIGETQTHLSVNHSAKQYARTDEKSGIRAHTNTVECFNSHLKRAVIGVFHQISAKHLARYTVEAAFRWNRRGIDTADRLSALVRQGVGRLLPFRQLVGIAA